MNHFTSIVADSYLKMGQREKALKLREKALKLMEEKSNELIYGLQLWLGYLLKNGDDSKRVGNFECM